MTQKSVRLNLIYLFHQIPTGHWNCSSAMKGQKIPSVVVRVLRGAWSGSEDFAHNAVGIEWAAAGCGIVWAAAGCLHGLLMAVVLCGVLWRWVRGWITMYL